MRLVVHDPTAPMQHDPGDRPRLKVAFCITELDVGGAEQCLAALACGIDRKRFEPLVLVLAPRSPEGRDALFQRLEQAGIRVVSLGGRSWLAAPWVLVRLTRELRRFRPDVLQTFLWHANLLGRIAARLAGVRHVVSGVRVAEQRSRWRLRLDRWTDALVDRHVAVSEAVAAFSRDEGGLPSVKIVVIPNGVDEGRFANAQSTGAADLGLPAGSSAILYVGRLHSQKRVDWLLRLLPEVVTACPQVYLLIAGTGPEANSLRRLASELRLEQRVRFLGFREDVPALLAASRVLVLPSAWEGMPNVVLEAMAAARPVLATDVQGVRELLGADWLPQTAPVNEPRTFAQKLIALARDHALCDQLGERNHHRAAHFSIAGVVARYADLYERLCRQS